MPEFPTPEKKEKVMKKSRAMALGLVSLAAVGLVGCSNDTGAGGSSDVLRVAGLAAGDHEGLVAINELFTAQTGTEVELTEDGSANYATTVRTQLGAGTAPDVFFVYPGNGQAAAVLPLAEAGLLQDLTSVGFASDIPEAYVSAATFDGKPYVVPQTQGVIGAIYNKTALDGAGLTPPTTFPGVLDFCAAAESAGKSAYALGFTDDFIQQMISYALTASLVYGPDPQFAEEQAAGDVSFEGSAWKDAFEQYEQMNDAGCFQDDFQGTSFNDAAAMVGSGDALGLVGVNAFLQQVQDSAPTDTVFQMEPLPATDDAADTRIPAAFAAGYAVNAKAKNMDAAMAYAELLASPEGQKVYAEKAAGLPVFITDDFEVNPVLSGMTPFLTDEKFASYPDQSWPNARVGKVHATVVSQLLAGSLTVDEALQEMDDAYGQGSE